MSMLACRQGMLGLAECRQGYLGSSVAASRYGSTSILLNRHRFSPGVRWSLDGKYTGKLVPQEKLVWLRATITVVLANGDITRCLNEGDRFRTKCGIVTPRFIFLPLRLI